MGPSSEQEPFPDPPAYPPASKAQLDASREDSNARL